MSGCANTARARLINCFWPGREQHAAFAHLGVVALFQRGDKLVRAGHFRGGFYCIIGRIQAPIANVLADRAREEMGRLQHHPDP